MLAGPPSFLLSLEENLVYAVVALPALEACLHSLARSPFFCLQSLQWPVRSFSHLSTLTLTVFPSAFKYLCDDIMPTQLIQNNLPILRSLD